MWLRQRTEWAADAHDRALLLFSHLLKEFLMQYPNQPKFLFILALVCGSTLCGMAGCATVGRKLDTASVDQIEKGKTTRQEVLASIGSPDQVSRNGSSDVTYTYTYSHSELTPASFIPYVGPLVGGTRSQNQTVVVTFGRDGIVKDINSTMGGMEMNQNLAAGGKAQIAETEDHKRAK
jgi:outer membrane protein assembly factor BamE (lipoprotein component of BamABCDE complex)